MSHLHTKTTLKIVGTLLILFALIPVNSFSASPPTTNYSIDASAEMGNNSWYISAVPITLTATPGTSPVESITHWIDSDPQTVSLSNPTTRTLIAQGQHVFNFFAKDTANITEATKTFNYKIDLLAPKNWSNFTLTNSGNAHTFTISITVSDVTSGLDNTSAEFQYSVDGGSTWGYYSNLTQCNSTWNDNQWRAASISPSTPGTPTGTITIPSTDYCNSNWSETKYIRIRVKDMAGLQSTKQYALMAPWIQTSGGDIYSNGPIDMLTENGPAATGIVITATDTINNFTSTQGWNIKDYEITSQSIYSTFYNKFGGSAQPFPSSIPTTLGSTVFIGNDTAVNSSYIPAQLSTAQNIALVVFINGDLFIDGNIQLHPSSHIVWIVSGNVGIRNSVTRADGIYFIDGEFDSSYNGNSSNQLLITGSIFANQGIHLTRSLSNSNNLTTPAERIVFSPGVFFNTTLTSLMRIATTITWKEYTPY